MSEARRITIGLSWVGLLILGAAAIVQAASSVQVARYGSDLPFVTEPCAEVRIVLVGLVLLVPTIIGLGIVVACSAALRRRNIRTFGLGLASVYVIALVLPLAATVGPRFGSDWSSVRGAWAQSIDDKMLYSWEHPGPAMTVWIGERRVTMRLLHRDGVRLDLGRGAVMNLDVSTMQCLGLF